MTTGVEACGRCVRGVVDGPADGAANGGTGPSGGIFGGLGFDVRFDWCAIQTVDGITVSTDCTGCMTELEHKLGVERAPFANVDEAGWA